MIRIAELSKDIAKKYRENKKNKLQRTFVSASNAAENKISKLKTIYKYLLLILFFIFREKSLRSGYLYKLEKNTQIIKCTLYYTAHFFKIKIIY